MKHDKMEIGHESLDAELAWIKGVNNSEERERIAEQFMATRLTDSLDRKLGERRRFFLLLIFHNNARAMTCILSLKR